MRCILVGTEFFNLSVMQERQPQGKNRPRNEDGFYFYIQNSVMLFFILLDKPLELFENPSFEGRQKEFTPFIQLLHAL